MRALLDMFDSTHPEQCSAMMKLSSCQAEGVAAPSSDGAICSACASAVLVSAILRFTQGLSFAMHSQPLIVLLQ